VQAQRARPGTPTTGVGVGGGGWADDAIYTPSEKNFSLIWYIENELSQGVGQKKATPPPLQREGWGKPPEGWGRIFSVTPYRQRLKPRLGWGGWGRIFYLA